MRLSELAEASGVPIPTIKYYVREGLLPPGTVTSPRQSDYGREHLDRLRLVRALVEVGGLSLTAVHDVLDAMAGPGGPSAAVGVAHQSLPPRPATTGEPSRARRAVAHLGWQVSGDGSAMHQLEAALAAAESVGLEPGEARLAAYGEAALRVAEVDVGGMADDPQAAQDPVRYAVLGTVLYEPLLLALRRLAQQHLFESRQR